MTGALGAPSVLDVALDAAVRHHFEALNRSGLCMPFDEIGERSRRIVRQQLSGVVTAVVKATTEHVASGQALELVGRGLASENGYTAAEWNDPDNASMRVDHLYDAHSILTTPSQLRARSLCDKHGVAHEPDSTGWCPVCETQVFTADPETEQVQP